MEAIILLLDKLMPLISYAPDLIEAVQSMIASLSADPKITPADLAALKALDARCDAAFETAAVAAGAAPEA